MKNKSPDSDDIERAVYDGMQDLRSARPAARRRPKSQAKSKAKRAARRRGRA